MIQAVRDWVRSRDKKAKEDIEKEFLKKTGDASKVTNVFSTYGSRTLPASGERLDITLGKIRKFLGDLSTMAFSNDYDNLSYKPIRSSFLMYEEATTEEVLNAEVHLDVNNALLIYGVGGASTSSNTRGKVDFFRAYLLACDKAYSDDDGNDKHKGKMIQLGSLGSVARWSLYPTNVLLVTNPGFYVGVKVPKGSWANVQALRIPLYTQYASNK